MAGDLLQRIHSNLSTGSGDWSGVRAEVTGAYASENGSGVNYVYFSNHVIREFNDKITDLNLPTGLYLNPFDAGSRYVGTGDFSAYPATPPVTSQSFVVPFRKTAFYETDRKNISTRFYGEFDNEHNNGLSPSSASNALDQTRRGKSGGSRDSSITLGDVRLSDSDFSAGGRHFDEVEFGVDSTRARTFFGYYFDRTAARGQYFSAVIFHFSNITVKQGATISSAKLKVNKSTPTSGSDQGEAVKIAAIFGDDSDFTRFPNKRKSTVTWTNFYNLAEDTQLESPDISSIIQEIVNLATWQSGNDISLYMFYEAGGSQSSYSNSASLPAQTLLKVKSGYDSSGNVTTSEAPTLEITSDGGSDFSGTIIEGAESREIQKKVNQGTGGGFRTFSNSGANPSVLSKTSFFDHFGRVRSDFSAGGYYSTAGVTFRGFLLRFPNIPLAQGATVPTTRLSIVLARDANADPDGSQDVNFVDGTRNFNRGSSDDANPTFSSDSHHNYSTGNSGLSRLVGVRVRAIKVTDVSSNFTGINASHASGLAATGGNTTDAFVDIPLDSLFPLDFVGSSNGKGKKTREGDRIETPDMKAILQEIVDQAGWSENNAIALLFYLPEVHSDNAVEGTTSPRHFRVNFFLGSNLTYTQLSHYSNIEFNTTQFSGRATSDRKIVGKTPKLLIGD